jgi:DNA-binding HxlR family transcriptional regulator
MTQRSYRQYCPIAHALDGVGDRWALLVVRDLLLGPKRFGDLMRGLPGIATNVLTDRLKGLEAAGVVRRRVLEPPAASSVYELTARGRDLQGVVEALARWGGRTLGPLEPGQTVSEESVMLGLRTVFESVALAGGRTTYEVRLEEGPSAGVFGVRVDGADGEYLTLARGAPDDPDAAIRTDAETLFAISSGRESLREAVDRGAVALDASSEVMARLVGQAERRGPGDVRAGGDGRRAPGTGQKG